MLKMQFNSGKKLRVDKYLKRNDANFKKEIGNI